MSDTLNANAEIRAAFNAIPDYLNQKDRKIIKDIERELLNISADTGAMLFDAAKANGGVIDLNDPTFQQAIKYSVRNEPGYEKGNLLKALENMNRKLLNVQNEYDNSERKPYFESLKKLIDERGATVSTRLSTQEGVESLIRIGMQKKLVEDLVLSSDPEVGVNIRSKLRDTIAISPELQSILLADPNQFQMLKNIVGTEARKHILRDGANIETMDSGRFESFAAAVNKNADALVSIQGAIRKYEEEHVVKIDSKIGEEFRKKVLSQLPEQVNPAELLTPERLAANIRSFTEQKARESKAKGVLDGAIFDAKGKGLILSDEAKKKLHEKLLPVLNGFDSEYLDANQQRIKREILDGIKKDATFASRLRGELTISSTDVDKMAKKLEAAHATRNEAFVDAHINAHTKNAQLTLAADKQKKMMQQFAAVTNTPLSKDKNGKIDIAKLRGVSPGFFDEMVFGLSPNASLNRSASSQFLPAKEVQSTTPSSLKAVLSHEAQKLMEKLPMIKKPTPVAPPSPSFATVKKSGPQRGRKSGPQIGG